jgi:hypothetical protein
MEHTCQVCRTKPIDINTICVECRFISCNSCWYAWSTSIQTQALPIAMGADEFEEMVALVEAPPTQPEVKRRDHFLCNLSDRHGEGYTGLFGTCKQCECPLYLDRRRRRLKFDRMRSDVKGDGGDVSILLSAILWLIQTDLDCIDMCCTEDSTRREQQIDTLLERIATTTPDHIIQSPSSEIVRHIVQITIGKDGD